MNEDESVRKENDINLVTVDITCLNAENDSDKKNLIKHFSPWTKIFGKNHDNLTFKLVNEHSSGKSFIILQGTRKETEDEFRNRMGLEDENSWTVQYMELNECTKKEAKEEMTKMLKNNMVTTPENWMLHKQSVVEEFLNIR